MLTELSIIETVQRSMSGPAGPAVIRLFGQWLLYFLAGYAVYVSFQLPRFKRKKFLIDLMIGSALAFGLVLFVSGLVERVRPFQASRAVQLIVAAPSTTYSFPSGHAAVAFALAGLIVLTEPFFGWLAFLMAVFIAFGRVAGGVHYPTDVLAGAAIGLGVAVLLRDLRRAPLGFWMSAADSNKHE